MFLSRRYHAPADDGGILIDPPLDSVQQLFDSSRDSATVLGQPRADFRAAARREVLELCAAYHRQFNESVTLIDSNRWIIAGHQPNLFHPGVWLKNFVLARLGREQSSFTLNLIVDNDEVKTTAIRVPTTDGRPVSIPLDQPVHGIAFEEWRIKDEALFPTVPDQVQLVTGDWTWPPFVSEFWHKLRDYSHHAQIADRLVPARRHFERTWTRLVGNVQSILDVNASHFFPPSPGFAGEGPGVRVESTTHREPSPLTPLPQSRERGNRIAESPLSSNEPINLELPVSWLCRTSAFAAFVSWIVADLDRFRECYNSVVHEYRQAHGIRSVNHPVSDLQESELPFWTWTKNNPKRTRLMANQVNAEIIRPRALTLTMFVRLALGDLFIHGIGGAKYDELTDAIAERFFGVTLSPYMVVSGTLRLPFEVVPADDIHQLQRQRRELQWNPHRAVPTLAPDLADKRVALLRLPTDTRKQRRVRSRLLRDNLEQWRPLVSDQLTGIDHRIASAHRQRHANAVLQSREHPFVLFSEERLRDWFAKVIST